MNRGWTAKILAAANHDLRQPLQALHLYRAALERHADLEQAAKIGASMQTSLDTLTLSIKALAVVSNLDCGSRAPAPEPVSIAKLYADVVADLQPRAQECGLTVSCEADDMTIVADGTLLRLLIGLLVEHAARSAGRGAIHLRCEPAPEGACLVVYADALSPSANTLQALRAVLRPDAEPRVDDFRNLGLALSLAAHISAELGCELALDAQSRGGARFGVQAPVASVPS